MRSANAWTFPANDPAPRADDGWSARARLGFTDILTLLWGQKWLMAAIFIVIFASGLAFAMTMKTEYTANASLLVKLGDEHVYHPRAGEAAKGATTDQDAIIDPERVILGSSGLHRKVVERIGIQKLYPDIAIGSTPAQHDEAMAKAVATFGKNFDSAAGSKMPTIPLSFKHDNPAMAALALNDLIDEYQIYRRSLLLNSNGGAITAEKLTREQQLAAKDDEIQAFLTFNHIGDFDTEKTLLAAALTQQEQQRYQLNSSLSEARGRVSSANSGLTATPAEVAQSRDLDTSGGQALNKLNNDLAGALGSFKPESVVVQNLRQQIAGQQEAQRRAPPPNDLAIKVGANPVRQTLESERNTAQNGAAGLEASLGKTNQQIDDINRRLRELTLLEPEYRRLTDERKNLADSVSDFDKRELESTASDAIARTSQDNVRVLSYAEPPLQGSSKRKIIAILAFLFAAFTALCAGLFNVFMKPGLPTAMAAGRTLDLPVLATARRR